jgi:RNase P/RNase MRP subunit POP5
LSATLFVAQRYLKHQMKPVRSVSRASVWRLRLLATVLAVAGQLGIPSASLALARDESSAISHTERSGIDLHRGHNEATCASCTALSFYANVDAVSPAIASEAISREVLAQRSVNFATGPQLLLNSCRAPPREA